MREFFTCLIGYCVGWSLLAPCIALGSEPPPVTKTRARVDADARASQQAVQDLKAWIQTHPHDQREVLDPPFARVPLSAADANLAADLLFEWRREQLQELRRENFEQGRIELDGLVMPFAYRTFGERPAQGHSLYISLHGGGGTTAQVNDQQWRNQQRLYEPDEGIYVAPRAPTDTWNLWHQPHIDLMFDRLIEMFCLFEDIDLDRVYLLGYSAGGDGVYQLAPRMADRWAAAAMMAGHPNDAQPLGLRNIGFALHMGENDAAFNRNEVARQWQQRLAELSAYDPGGYRHVVKLHEGKGHWMDREDAEAIQWMAQFTRDPWPSKVVWLQSPVTHTRYYWLWVPPEEARGGALIKAHVEGNTIAIDSDEVSRLSLLLHDDLIDLGQPVTVLINGQLSAHVTAPRTIANLAKGLLHRFDRRHMYPVQIDITRW